MSREVYQAPTLITEPTAGQSSNANAFGTTSSGIDRGTPYRCGECNTRVIVKRGDAIRCKDCGYRVLYKERTNRMVQFEAR